MILRPMAVGLAAGFLALLLPLAAVGKDRESSPPVLTADVPTQPAQTLPAEDTGRTLRILMDDGSVETMTMEDYLWRVVAAEMPASFEEEALRAQAVCARTYALWKMANHAHGEADLCADSACCQAYLTPEKAEERWGDRNTAYTQKIKKAVSDTDGMILTYEGEPIQAVFFSSSTDTTEDAREVWGSAVPYLVSVESWEGEEVPNYHSAVTLSAEELRQAVKESGMTLNLSGDPGQWISKVRYTASGRVAELDLGGVTLSGGAVRSMLGLRSACFDISEKDGVFTFAVTGYGHGVGMSQYGANAMAAQGSSWQEIVNHYYTGVTIASA